MNFNRELKCWVIQQSDLLNDLNNETSWLLQQSNTTSTMRVRLEMMFWSVWCDSVEMERESPRFRHSRALLVTRHCSHCDVTTWRRLQLSLPGWLMREVLLRRLSCRGPWHRFFPAPFLITVRILHSVSASSLTVLLARSCVSFDRSIENSLRSVQIVLRMVIQRTLGTEWLKRLKVEVNRTFLLT